MFYATPILLGGLGLNTPTIGTILAVQRIRNDIMYGCKKPLAVCCDVHPAYDCSLPGLEYADEI
jgi:hypothetical protein